MTFDQLTALIDQATPENRVLSELQQAYPDLTLPSDTVSIIAGAIDDATAGNYTVHDVFRVAFSMAVPMSVEKALAILRTVDHVIRAGYTPIDDITNAVYDWAADIMPGGRRTHPLMGMQDQELGALLGCFSIHPTDWSSPERLVFGSVLDAIQDAMSSARSMQKPMIVECVPIDGNGDETNSTTDGDDAERKIIWEIPL